MTMSRSKTEDFEALEQGKSYFYSLVGKQALTNATDTKNERRDCLNLKIQPLKLIFFTEANLQSHKIVPSLNICTNSSMSKYSSFDQQSGSGPTPQMTLLHNRLNRDTYWLLMLLDTWKVF